MYSRYRGLTGELGTDSGAEAVLKATELYVVGEKMISTTRG